MLSWNFLLEVLVSTGYGVLSSIIPLFNAEAYIIASQVSGLTGEVTIAIGCAVGQTIGKILMFVGVRRGQESTWFRRRTPKLKSPPPGSFRAKMSIYRAKMLALVGTKRWGLPVLFVSSLTGFPPLYAVGLIAPRTEMKLIWFSLMVLLGRVILFLAIALGVAAIWPSG